MVLKRKQGFTIVELLIVVVVIAILAAITVVAYNGISKKALEVSLKSDLSTSSRLLENDRIISSDGIYPVSLENANGGKGVKASNGTTYQYRVNNSGTPKTFCLTVTNGTTSFYIDQGNAINAGACAGHGAGGATAITNYDNGAGSRSVSTNAPSGGAISSASTATPFGTGDQRYFYASYPTASSSKNLYLCSAGVDGLGNALSGGQTYTFSAWVRPSWSGSQSQLFVRSYNGSTFSSSSVSTSTATTANQWQRFTYTYTLPANAISAMTCVVYAAGTSASPPAGSRVDFSGFMITQGSTVYTYADGNSPGWAWSDGGVGPGPATSSGVPL